MITLHRRPSSRIGDLLLVAVLAVSPASAATYYVATDGDDANSGTLEAPFQTVAHAQSVVRGLIAGGLMENVDVILRGGTYRLDAPLVFGPADSGDAAYAITYRAFADEIPVISGGREVGGWTAQGNDLWSTSLADVQSGQWWFRQLFVDGQRAQRARFPNPGNYFTLQTVSPDVKTFTMNGHLFVDLAGKDSELVVRHNWAISRSPIASTNDDTIVTTTPTGNIGHSWTTAAPGREIFFEHAPSFIDQVAEWYLERATGELRYLASSGEDPNTLSFIASAIRHLVIVEGTAADPVENLHFEGITFEHSQWTLPAEGYDEVQAGHYSHQWGSESFVIPVAFELSYASDCSVDSCRFRHLGASAIGLGPRARNNTVSHCIIEDVGGTGIMVGYRGNRDTEALLDGATWLSTDWPDPADVPDGNVITQNLIQQVGQVAWGAVGIWEAFCTNSHIHHNLVRDTPYTGISLGFNWHNTTTSHLNVVVEYNRVKNVMQVLNDGGCIYTLGHIPGAVLRNNLLHGVGSGETAGIDWQNNNIFFDQGTNNWLITRNILYDPSTYWAPQGAPFASFIRFNPGRNDDMNFAGSTEENPGGDNSIGVSPGDPDFPHTDADLAGLQPSAPEVTLSRQSVWPYAFQVTVHGEPWTEVASAEIVGDGPHLDVRKTAPGVFESTFHLAGRNLPADESLDHRHRSGR